MDQLPNDFTSGSYNSASKESVYSKYLKNSFKEAPGAPKDDSSGSDGDSDSDSDDDKEEFPITHEFPLKSHNKKITSVKFSHSGHRLFTGGADYNFNVYDFNTMNPASNSPYKSVEVYETHPILKIDINRNNEILAIPNDLSFKVIDTDGAVLKEFREGDRYIYDMKTTRGHTDVLTDGSWDPNDPTKFITSSDDSTFRLWDYTTGKQEKVNFMKNKGKKTIISKVTYTTDSKSVLAVDSNSTITRWELSSSFNRPINQLIVDGTITSINTNNDDPNSILIRTANNDLKLYDLRNFKTPVIQRLDFATSANSQPKTTLYHGQYVLAATSFNDLARPSELHILDRSDLATLGTVQFDEGITALDWNRRIDQIGVGLSSGKLSVLFAPEQSKNGVKISINNRPKKRNFDENENFITSSAAQVGYNMTELAQLNRSKKQKNPEAEESKSKQKFIWGTTDANTIENANIDEDPREALKKYAMQK